MTYREFESRPLILRQAFVNLMKLVRSASPFLVVSGDNAEDADDITVALSIDFSPLTPDAVYLINLIYRQRPAPPLPALGRAGLAGRCRGLW